MCYQLPAMLKAGLTLVISPLIALMKDQVDDLRLKGIEAAYLNSSQHPDEYNRIFNSIGSGTLKLLYIAPEPADEHARRAAGAAQVCQN